MIGRGSDNNRQKSIKHNGFFKIIQKYLTLNKTEIVLNEFRPLPSPENESRFNILKKMPPRRAKIPLLRRPELLLAEEFSSSLDPVTPAIWLAPFCPAVSWFFGFCWPTQSSQERIPTRAVADFVGTALFNSELTN